MHCFCFGGLRNLDYLRDVEVAFRGLSRPDVVGFVGMDDMPRFQIRIRIDCDSLDSEFPTSAYYPDGYFSAVRDENLSEHLSEARTRAEYCRVCGEDVLPS